MRPQTEELLYVLMWSADIMLRPTWRNLEGSFEAWAWRNGLARRLSELERQKLIERHPQPELTRVVRLTEQGRCQALGGRDPAALWKRRWDGRWRMVLFDLPTAQRNLRVRLWRLLRAKHFGYLQDSVWVSPDEATEVRTTLGEAKVQADTFLVMDGKPAAGESDAEIVAGAWDFSAINERYERHLEFLSKSPPTGTRLIEWARRENAAWRAALEIDPLLPAALLPPGYLGAEAFQRRRRVFANLARAAVQ